MRWRGLWAAGLLGLAGCADWFGPGGQRATLVLVPVFDAADPYRAAASTADSLRIWVLRDSAGVFRDTVARATAAIDSSGEVNASITVTLLRSPQQFKIVLQAFRSSDGVVVFSGESVVVVTNEATSGSGQQVAVPVRYTGPKARKIALAPKDTAVAGAASWTYRVTAFDSAGGVLSGVEVRFYLVNPADSTKLRVGERTGLATAVSGATGQVRVYARTADSGAYDTARVFVGAVPAGLRLTPGYANLVVGDTLTIAGQVVDPVGNPVPGTSVSWISRASSVATVTAGGRATGVAPGTAVLVATGSGFSDSVLVTVVAAGNAVVSTTSAGRAFRTVQVGDTVVVDLALDFRFTPTEKPGSYQAALDWNTSLLQFLDVQSTSFAAPTVNPGTGGCTHQLCLAAADPQNSASSVVVARVRLRALAAGSATSAVSVSELSSNVPPGYTNLYGANRVTVTSGTVTIRP